MKRPTDYPVLRAMQFAGARIVRIDGHINIPRIYNKPTRHCPPRRQQENRLKK